MLDTIDLFVILLVGLATGTVNTLVGGGTSIVVPLLHFLGLPLHEANATNRIAVCFQAMAASRSFRAQGVARWRDTLPPALCALLGGLPGAYLAAVLDPERFRVWVGWILIAALCFFFVKPANPSEPKPGHRLLGLLGAFLLGVYGGFLGAGVGVLILLLLPSLLRLDLVRMVAVKVLMVFFLSVSASGVFLYKHQVRWEFAVPLLIGSAAGGMLGARLAVLGGERWIRRIVAAVAAILAVVLLVGADFGTGS